MPPKKKKENNKSNVVLKGVIDGAGEIVQQKIATTIEENYMPYAMSVILSRAIPEIDGFKPSHRKLLYTMYKMNLLNGSRTKSANIVGQTMRLNPHGDSAIYDTMVRLSRGYEALLYPFVDSKGNFGKFYSRDMAWAASRYTEAKLDEICNELFRDIDKDTVDFVDNYDNTMKEPSLLPATFPSVLVNANTGIAVGMASSICSFNLKEICDTTIAILKNKNHDISSTLPAPDCSGGAYIIYDKKVFDDIYKTGRGSFKMRSKYTYDKTANCIDITGIPQSTTSEAIIEKIIELVKVGKIREISDVRDETGLDGLKITIDLKRGTDPDKLMLKLFKMTPLEDSFSCNFNILIGGVPKVLGVSEILEEWIRFRTECVKRRTNFDLNKKSDKLHLLKGLQKILLDIDKAVDIIRNTSEENQVVPNLIKGFGIDEIQAEYVAEIKLRHLNKEYILKRTAEIDGLEIAIAQLTETLENENKVKQIIIKELKEVGKKYGQPRKCMLLPVENIKTVDNVIEEIPDYSVNIFFTKEGYFKKITPQSLRMSSEQKLKENDIIIFNCETTNNTDLLFFTNKSQVYKTKVSEFKETKASTFGDYVPAKLGMADSEKILYTVVTKEYNGYMLFAFENGKIAKVPLSAYATKTNRKKLTGAYSDKENLANILFVENNCDIVLKSSNGKALIFNTSEILEKTSRTTIGVSVMTIKKGHRLISADIYQEGIFAKPEKYRKGIPAVGTTISSNDKAEQMTLL